MAPKKSPKQPQKPRSNNNKSKKSTTAAKDEEEHAEAKVPEKRKRSPTPPASDASLKALLTFLINETPSKYGAGLDAKQPNLFDLMTVSPQYTPFQNLVAAAVMSKPFSSRLGVRTLLTIFGGSKEGESGVDFTTPAKLRDAGEPGR